MTLNFTAPLRVNYLSPNMAFIRDINIHVSVQAEGLLNLTTLSCKIHDFITLGTYYVDKDNITFVNCVIPSLQYLNLTAVAPINWNNTMYIEVSNNGKDFSHSKRIFYFIPEEELLSVYPITGPEYGGTVLNISLAYLPFENGTLGDVFNKSQCVFPGYPAQNVVWINESLVQCTTPPLIENIENVTSTQSFATVWV